MKNLINSNVTQVPLANKTSRFASQISRGAAPRTMKSLDKAVYSRQNFSQRLSVKKLLAQKNSHDYQVGTMAQKQIDRKIGNLIKTSYVERDRSSNKVTQLYQADNRAAKPTSQFSYRQKIQDQLTAQHQPTAKKNK